MPDSAGQLQPLAPELVFDQSVGDLFTARVACNTVNQNILGSLEYASKVAGSRLVVVLGHTNCSASGKVTWR